MSDSQIVKTWSRYGIRKTAGALLRNISAGFLADERTNKKQIRELLYTPLQDALAELENRRQNVELCQKVDMFFGNFKPPKAFGKSPRAVMARYIASPTIEYEYFKSVQEGLRMDPLFLEFGSDKFVARNHEKYALCRLAFMRNNPDGRRWVVKKRRVVNFNVYEGKPLDAIKTEWGEPLVDFHHGLLRRSGFDKGVEVSDFSAWFKKSRSLSEEYYLYYLALFMVHGILFENFLFNEQEVSFTETRVVPAVKKLTKMFGVRPLIVPIVPLEAEEAPYWYYYDERIMQLLPDPSESHGI